MVANREPGLDRLIDDEAAGIAGQQLSAYEERNVHGICSHRGEPSERDQVRVSRIRLVCQRTLCRREPCASSDALCRSFSIPYAREGCGVDARHVP